MAHPVSVSWPCALQASQSSCAAAVVHRGDKSWTINFEIHLSNELEKYSPFK